MKALDIKKIWGLLFLLVSLVGGQTVMAQTFVSRNISTGHVVIQGTDVNNYHITGSTNQYKIIVGRGYQGKIKLTNVTITSSDTEDVFTVACGNGTNVLRTASCMAIMGLNNQSTHDPVTNVDLILEGTNRLTYLGEFYYCAIQVDQGAQIHISSIDPNDNASGILIAKATEIVPGSGDAPETGAGIGAVTSGAYNAVQGTGIVGGSGSGTDDTSGGNVIISSGTITAWGGHGAGIGGAHFHYYDGAIVIYGGIVESRGGFDAAGIGSGCPHGTGVLTSYTTNSTIVVLPPAQITAYGAGHPSSTQLPGGIGVYQHAFLGLAGTANIIYVNDPNKPQVTIRTVDNEPGANIYADLTMNPEVMTIFNTLGIPYDLSAVKFGMTNANGRLRLNMQMDQPVTFFTDASSSDPANQGRPYQSVTKAIPATPMTQSVVLPLLEMDVSIEIFPATSRPIIQGYSTSDAYNSAYRAKIVYNDPFPLSGINFELQNLALTGTTSFKAPVFLASDSTTVISAPSTLSAGDTIYVIVPLKDGNLSGIYTDVFRFNGTWKTNPTGWTRRVVEQRVVYDDTGINNHIKVTASPSSGAISDPSTYSVSLNLNITHAGASTTYNPLDVYAKYIISTEANYAAAVAAKPVEQWDNLTIPASGGVNAPTVVPFAGKTGGTYYIHWFVNSGLLYAHSENVISPPKTNGGFGPYSYSSSIQVSVNPHIMGRYGN